MRTAGFVLIALLGTAGCMSTPDDLDREMGSFVQEYLAQSERMANAEKVTSDRIKRLDVSPASNGAVYAVSAHLEKADLNDVVMRLLEELKQPYEVNGVSISGETTVLFSNLPHVDALNIILAPTGIAVNEQDGVLVFSTGSQPVFADAASVDGGPLVRTQIALRHIGANVAINLLGELQGEPFTGEFNDEDSSGDGYDQEEGGYGESDASFSGAGARPFYARSLSGLNVIYLSGPAAQVHEAIVLLRFADRERPHVIIEALVLEVNSSAIKRLSSGILDFAKGDVGPAHFHPGSSLNDAITFSFLRGAANPAQLTAMVDLLTETEYGHVISRPYTSTLSHETADIRIVEEEYVIVEEDGGARTTMPITAGITLEVTPVVLDNDIVRVKMYVESSEFHASADRATNIIDRSNAKSIVDVKSGQTIVVGGLYRRQTGNVNAGIPFLRKLPGVNMVFSKRVDETSEKEVIVYLTPHIWWADSASSPRPHDINRLMVGPAIR